MHATDVGDDRLGHPILHGVDGAAYLRNHAACDNAFFNPFLGLVGGDSTHDTTGKKMFVMGADTSRINVLEDNAYTVVARQPRAYRALKLFDLGDNRVESIVVKGEKEQFRLQENVGVKETTFTLTEPVKAEADTSKASNLLKDLGSLEATEYVYDPPSDAEKKELVELYTQVGKLDPPKGDKESWKKLTEELVKNGKALVEGKKDAAATLQKSCGACHSKHKKA